jgi:hypothetical protein
MAPVLNQGDLVKVKARGRLLDDRSELDAATSGYVKLLGTKNGPNDILDIWSQPHPSGVHEYLVLGRAPVRARVMYDVLMDDAYHADWDSHCSELRRLKEYPTPAPETTHALNHWVVKYPTPLRKRDYVYERLAERPSAAEMQRDGGKGSMYYFATRSVQNDAMPETSRAIRVTDFEGSYCLREATVDDQKPACEFLYIALGTSPASVFLPRTLEIGRRILTSMFVSLTALSQISYVPLPHHAPSCTSGLFCLPISAELRPSRRLCVPFPMRFGPSRRSQGLPSEGGRQLLYEQGHPGCDAGLVQGVP